MARPTPLVDVPDLIGISYRQADYWTRSGLIHSHLISRTTGSEIHPKFRGNGWTGTGLVRVLDDDELEVMALAADLVGAGMVPTPAVALARRLLAEPIGEVTVGRILLAYRPEQVGA